jgi:hypothetical protein
LTRDKITCKESTVPPEFSKRLAAWAFYLGLGCLFAHELDAMTQSEWRLLYVLRSLPDATAMPWFVALHVPLFGLLGCCTTHSPWYSSVAAGCWLAFWWCMRGCICGSPHTRSTALMARSPSG